MGKFFAVLFNNYPELGDVAFGILGIVAGIALVIGIIALIVKGLESI